jgi:hypothetical protein
MKINIEGNLITTTADSELHVVISGARGPQGPAGDPGEAGVPYTGAIQDVNLGEFGLQAGNIEFDNTPTNIPTTDGSVYWSDTDGTLALRLKGGNVISKIGETQHIRAYNNTGTAIAKGKVVYVTGSQGQRLTIALADADTEILSKDTIGITAEAIADGSEGFVIVAGVLTNISTTGLADGDTVFLSQTAGSYTKTPPAGPAHLVVLGFVVNGGSGGAGSIYVKVDNGYELEELHNVSDAAKTSVVDNDAFLLRDSADNNLWKRLTWANLKAAVKTYIDTFKGVAGGYASLDGSGKVPASELPSYVDDVIEVANYAALPVTGETGKIYITLDNNKVYRWSGSVYVEIASGGGGTWGTITGTLSNQTDLQNALNAKQNSLTFDSTPTNGSTNPVTSDGVFDALALKQDTLTNPVTGTGTSGQVSYWSGTNTQAGSNNLFWDNANNRLGVGTNAPVYISDFLQTSTQALAIGSISQAVNRSFFFGYDTGTARRGMQYGTRSTGSPFIQAIDGTVSSVVEIQPFGGSLIVGNVVYGAEAKLSVVQSVNGITGIFKAFNTTDTALVVQGVASQTGNLLSFRNSTPTVLSYVSADGSLSLGLNTNSARLHVRGSGTTSSTTALLVQNSTPTANFTIRDDGGYAFRGGTVGVAQTGYTTFTNLTTDRTCDANATTVEELADILGTLIEDLKTKGIIAA